MTRKPGGHNRKQLVCQPRAPTAARGQFLLLVHNSHSHLLENYSTKLLRDVTETYFRGTASDQHWQALAAPPLPEKGQCVPMTQAQLTHTGRDDPGLQVLSALENLLPHRARKGSWRLHGRGCVGTEEDLQLQVSRWTQHTSKTEPADLTQPRTRSCILISSCHRPPTSSHPLPPLW